MKNAFVALAKRAALERWSLEDANRELKALARGSMPRFVEMDEARELLGSQVFDFELASAIDMLFDADIEGIPDDPEHNRGNVHYFLAHAWLDRVRLGETRGEPHFWRHCAVAREFYATWPIVVLGAPGHPTWAGVLELEAQMLCFSTPRPTLSNLKRGLDLCSQAARCYPPTDKYCAVIAWEAQIHFELATREHEEAHLRKTLEKVDAILPCLPPGDETRVAFLSCAIDAWTRLEPHASADDRARADHFIGQAFGETDPGSDLFSALQKLRSVFMRPTYHIDKPRSTGERFSRAISRLLLD